VFLKDVMGNLLHGIGKEGTVAQASSVEHPSAVAAARVRGWLGLGVSYLYIRRHIVYEGIKK
jgi:hypothetical protein